MLFDVRRGLLGWREFKEEKILLISAAEDLLDRQIAHERIGNLEEIAGYYDLIILMQVIPDHETRVKAFRMIKEHLTARGRILYVTPNRLAVRYLCGAYDEYVSEPFNYLSSGLPDREGLEKELSEAGYAETFFYYPCFDRSFPQVIYSDDCLPADFEDDRIIIHEKNDGLLLGDLKEAFRQLCQGRRLKDHANSFLVEASLHEETETRTVKVISSLDREEEKATYLCFRNDGTVIKKAADPQGKPYLHQQYRNLQELKDRGIGVVDTQETEKGLLMPWLKDKELLGQIKDHHEDKEWIIAVFDQLQENIRKSADEVPGRPGILKKACIDMIPFNCFRIGDELVYYDQEFVREDCPLSYVMFRAIFYACIHVPELKKTLRDGFLYDRYGISKDLYKRYVADEMRFVETVRSTRREDMQAIDQDRISQRRNMVFTQAIDPYGLKEVHEVQLKMLEMFAKICKENDLHYFVIHGTLLGAVRNNALIPWDEDADIAMPRADLERLKKLSFPDPYFLQTMENDEACFYGGYVKLRNSATCAREAINADKDCNQGIWIDIFPLDQVAADPRERRLQQKRITHLQRLLYAKKYPLDKRVLKDLSDGKRYLYHLLRRLYRAKDLYKRLDEECSRVKDSPYLAILACYYGNYPDPNIYEKEWFAGTEMMKLDGLTVPVPSGYEQILRSRYGDDYRHAARKIEENVHFDAHRSYKEKKEKEYER